MSVEVEPQRLQSARSNIIRLDLHDWRTHGFDSKDVAIVIDHADYLSDRLFFGTFVAVLCQAAWRANLRLDSDGFPDDYHQPFNMHAVLLLDTRSPTDLIGTPGSAHDIETSMHDGRLLVSLDETEWPTTIRTNRMDEVYCHSPPGLLKRICGSTNRANKASKA